MNADAEPRAAAAPDEGTALPVIGVEVMADRSWTRVIAFLICTVLFGMIGYFTLPDRAPVHSPARLELAVSSTELVNLSTNVHDAPGGGTQISITLFASRPSSVTVDASVLAGGDLQVSCSDCKPTGTGAHFVGLLANRRFGSQPFPYGDNFSFIYKGAGIGWSDNGLTTLASLPKVTVTNTGPAAKGTPNVNTVYMVPDASEFDWGYDPQPVRADTHAVQWDELPELTVSGGAQRWTTATLSQISAPNAGAQHSDDIRLLLAGALIGTAGAAFLTGVDGFMEPYRRRRRARVSQTSSGSSDSSGS